MLFLLFPLALIVLVYVTMLIAWLLISDPLFSPVHAANQMAYTYMPVIFIVAVGWMFVSYISGGDIMLATAGAKEIDRDSNPEIYALVENVVRTSGLPMPRVYIIKDESLNAFATGRSPNKAAIAFTSGILKVLNKSELEGVIAHEISHIANRDVMLMMIVITGIGVFTLIGQLLIRFGGAMAMSRGRSSGRGNPGGLLVLFGFAMLIYGLFLAPLIMYGLSRRREYQADASAALLTRNPGALASALAKISHDSRVEALDKMPLMSAACIEETTDEKRGEYQSFLSGVFSRSTHPPISLRIKALNQMEGNY